VRPFPRLTALDNVLVGIYFGHDRLRARARRSSGRGGLERVGLAAKADVRAGELTILERKRLSRPRHGRLAEARAAGVHGWHQPIAVPDAVGWCGPSGRWASPSRRGAHHQGHLSACDRVIVLDAGVKLAEGSVDEVVADRAVIEAYLGSRHARG
jgi:branched-chain amino acid transport system ATP-binding protein